MVMAPETTSSEVLSPFLPVTAWVSMFYFMESATIIIFFARLVHFQGGEGCCEKEYSLYVCDNDEKDIGRNTKK
jgi:hypothetical protein